MTFYQQERNGRYWYMLSQHTFSSHFLFNAGRSHYFFCLIMFLGKYTSFVGLSYALLAICVSILLTSENSLSVIPSNTQISSYMGEVVPIIGLKNASAVIQKRVLDVHTSFEEVLKNSSSSWTSMRIMDNLNLSIYMQDSGNDLSPYVKSTIFINAEPKSAYKLFSWRNFHETLSSIDPFYESAETLLKVSRSCMLIRKVKLSLFRIQTGPHVSNFPRTLPCCRQQSG